MKISIKTVLIIFFCILPIVSLFSAKTDVTTEAPLNISAKKVQVVERIEMSSDKNISEVLKLAFKKFYKYIRKAGYEDLLKEATSVTIFAPTDQAFKELKDFLGIDAYSEIFKKTYTQEGLNKLRRLLNLHMVLKGAKTSFDLMNMTSIQPYGGERTLKLKTEDGVIKIDDTNAVVQADIIGTNGVVHAITAVVLP